MTPLRILSITSRPVKNGTLWRITASDGQRYSTRNPWRASLCKRALDTNVPVQIWSSTGWFDRDITYVVLAVQTQEASA